MIHETPSEYFLFKGKCGNFLSRNKSKLYFSCEPDKILCYRFEKQAKNFLKDKAYFEYRNINVDDIKIVKCKFTIIELEE